ncbi:MAG TPA: hypothetical protein VL475_11805, partial [Planctomycetaceae bacterium]|nr:hypothetical protein [Planctomycetaceae bacterium]
VKNPEGEVVGNIDDLVIDGRNGQVLYALLASAARGNQASLTVMPWTVLQSQYGPNEADRYLIVDVEPQRLAKAPTVTRSQWPTVVYSEWNQWQPRFDSYYKTEIEQKHKKHKDEIKIKEKRRDED